VHIARKQYLDGSIPTGFQRTAIVGVNGKLPFRGRTLSITQVSVEEDSCREVSDRGHLIVWRTDRLGMPLIETVTGPDLRTPHEVEEAILLIGLVCRSTGHVRVGMGASRQDVNVSVRGGRRVEIKGVPKAGWAPKLVHGEAVRQSNLLQLRAELHRRGFRQPDDLRIEHTDETAFFETSQLTYLRRKSWDRFLKETRRRPGLELGEGPFCVRVVKLKGLAGTLGWPTQPEHNFAHELAGRIRVIAALDQQPILLHSEKWPDYDESQRELRRLKKLARCGDNDSLVVVWGAFDDTLTAAEEILLRYVDAIDGVPHETRQPFEDGSTDFERILPGPDRMYPDTDSPPTRMTKERVENLRATLSSPPWEREKLYSAAGVPKNTIRYLIRRNGAALVDRVVENCDADLRQACFFFGERLKGLRRSGVPVDNIPPARWVEFFQLLKEKPLLWETWRRLVVRMANTPDGEVGQIADAERLGGGYANWTKLVGDVVTRETPYRRASPEGRFRFYMGKIMASLRGMVPAREVAEELRISMPKQGMEAKSTR
jgi:glutamyl-tRNA(Gln) amidotransferase subunit E